jgi:hypothetical protein
MYAQLVMLNAQILIITPPWLFSPKEHQNIYGKMLPSRTGLLNRRHILNRTLFVMYNPKTGHLIVETGPCEQDLKKLESDLINCEMFLISRKEIPFNTGRLVKSVLISHQIWTSSKQLGRQFFFGRKHQKQYTTMIAIAKRSKVTITLK